MTDQPDPADLADRGVAEAFHFLRMHEDPVRVVLEECDALGIRPDDDEPA